MRFHRVLYSVYQYRYLQKLGNWMIEQLASHIPSERLLETERLVAFYHPRPAYPVHIVLLPKRAIAGLMAVQADEQGWLYDLIPAVQQLVQRLNLEKAGYRLILNGGAYQTFPQLHFHLISGD